MSAVAFKLQIFYGEQDETVQALKRTQPHLFDLASEKGLSPTQIRTIGFAIGFAGVIPPLKRELLLGTYRQPNVLEEFGMTDEARRVKIEACIGAHLRSRAAREPVRQVLAAVLRTVRLQLSHPGR